LRYRIRKSVGSNVKHILNNRYEIKGIINSGAFSMVYHAYDQWLKGDVAIKELSPLTRISSQEALVKRFKREARITRRLRHPYIIEIYDLFWAQDTLYIVMPYLPDSLDKRLKHTACLDLSESVHLMTQICEGLAYAHTAFRDKQGVYPIVHCDIKPGNILFDEFDQVKIADFGIAHIPPLPGIVDQVSVTSFNAGTIAYMPPEQLDGERTNPRIDIYALGALFYRMVAGCYYLDFEEVTTEHALQDNQRRIRYEAPARAPLETAHVPRPLIDIIFKALAKDPQARYPHAGAMLDALHTYTRDAEAAAPPLIPAPDVEKPAEAFSPPAIVQPADIKKARPPSHRPYLAIAVIALLVLGFGAVVTGILKSTPQTPVPSAPLPSQTSPSAPAPSPPLENVIPLTATTPAHTAVSPSQTPAPSPVSLTPTDLNVPPPACTVNPPPGWQRYSVKAGDDLTQLALSCRVSMQDLANINCIRDEDRILAGQSLYLPGGCALFHTATPSAPPTPTTTPIISPTRPSSPTPSPVTPQVITPTQTALPTHTPVTTPTLTATPPVTPTDTLIEPTPMPKAIPEDSPTPTLPPTQPPSATPTLAPTIAPTTPATDTQAGHRSGDLPQRSALCSPKVS
jgi:serine/threonine-protein kinase